MTTIAYHQKSQTIAADSRQTRSGIIVTDSCTKFAILKDGAIAFLCGSISDYEHWLDAYYGNEPGVQNPDAVAFVVKNGIVYRAAVDSGKIWFEQVNHNDAHGSGAEFALAAMDFGKDARGAVEYAKTRDSKTGGRVIVIDVSTGRRVK